MPTVKEKIIADATAGGKELNARRLFIVFSAIARKNYKYSATKIKGNEGNTLLARPDSEVVTVDCASLADALVLLLNDLLDDSSAELVNVFSGMGFATQQSSRCFDTRVTGNIRTPSGQWGDTSRCVFNQHYFVASGRETRMLFDPCMFTTYSSMEEVKSWTFVDGGGKFNSIIKTVTGDQNTVLIRLPPNYTGQKPIGFESGFIIFNKNDFSKDEFKALQGARNNPQWTREKYNTKAEGALAKVNKLLNEKAGITGAWT